MIQKTLYLLLFITTYSYGQYTSIPDINFEKTLIKLGYDDPTPDGKILTSKIEKITFLNIPSNSISDLNGIQDFSALEFLSCGNNNLSMLDVSKNEALTVLSCANNKLTSLNISKNIVLANLFCENNLITNLDLSKNQNLKNLTCTNNKLINLNLKNGKNNLLSFSTSDFKKNPNLSCIQVDSEAYSANNWSNLKDATASYYELDCTAYTAIPDINFEKTLISKGIDKDGLNGKILTFTISKLTQLNIDNNTSSLKIIDLTGIHDFTELTHLDCSNNTIESLDLSNNLKLETIYCRNNKLASLNINKNLLLKRLVCYQNKLVDLNVSNNTALTELDCANNKLSNLDVSRNIELITLNCNNNQLSSLNSTGAVKLEYLTCTFNQIKTLNFSTNIKFKRLDGDFNQLTSIDISKNINLTDLLVSGNQISDLDVKKNTNLKQLNCYSNKLTDLDISKNLALTNLNCGVNQLKNIDVSKNLMLTNFGCGGNQLSTLNVSANKLLTDLSCIDNQLKTIDVSMLTDLRNLKCSNNVLQSLNLKNSNNGLIGYFGFDCRNNPNLGCIQVDDITYSNNIWTLWKDKSASFSTSCLLGIEDSVFDKIVIYPNPTNGKLHIKNVTLEKTTLYNATGQFIRTNLFTIGSSENTIDLSGNPAGVYYIYLETEGKTAIKKIILK